MSRKRLTMFQVFPGFDAKSSIRRLHEDNRKFGSKLQKIAKEHWPGFCQKASSREIIGVWRSKDFLLIEYEEPNCMRRLTVCRTMINKNGELLDGISWDDLQRLKGEAGYTDFDAVEIFPKDSNVVNVANMRHLWINLANPNAVWFAWKHANNA